MRALPPVSVSPTILPSMSNLRLHTETASMAQAFVRALTAAGHRVEQAPGLRLFAGTYAPWRGPAMTRYDREVTPSMGVQVLRQGVSSLDAVGSSWTGEACTGDAVPPAAEAGDGPWTCFADDRFHQHGMVVLRHAADDDAPQDAPTAESITANLVELQLVRHRWYALLRMPIAGMERGPEGWPMQDVLLHLVGTGDALSWVFLATTRITVHPEAFTHICVFHAPGGIDDSADLRGRSYRASTIGRVALPPDTTLTPGPDEAWLMMRYGRAALGGMQLVLTDDQGTVQRASARTGTDLGPDRVALRMVVSPARRYSLSMGEGGWPLFRDADLSAAVSAAVAGGGTAAFPEGLPVLGFPSPDPSSYGRTEVAGEDGAYDDMSPEDHEAEVEMDDEEATP